MERDIFPKTRNRRLRSSGEGVHCLWGRMCEMVCERVGKKRDPDHQRDGARDRRKRPERRADWRRDDLCSVGKRRGYLLSEGAHRAVYGYSGTWRRDSVGTAAGDETICMEFSEAQPDHQCAVRRGARDGGEGKKRFPDHRQTLHWSREKMCMRFPDRWEVL